MNSEPGLQTTTRRDFLVRMLKGGISIAAACSLSYLLYDRNGPGQTSVKEQLVTLPDFSLPDADMSITESAGLAAE